MELVKNKNYRIGIKKEYKNLFPYFHIDSALISYNGASNDVTLEWMINLHDIMRDNYNKIKRFVSTSLDKGHTRNTLLEGLFIFSSNGDIELFYSTLLENKSLHYLCEINYEGNF